MQIGAIVFYVWFGLSDEVQGGTWRWSSTGAATTYYEWDSGQPDYNDYYAVLSFPGLKWHDTAHILQAPFMCEYRVKWGHINEAPATMCSIKYRHWFVVI